ncbi:hypothetical protein J4444_00630 [Candidatus Woesearchaeota archaeon]|nr:hypothetical protein [Candidatus Woesearchaeota archaeon]
MKKRVKHKIKVKQESFKLPQRLKSGIINLDPLIKGGFKEGSVTLVIGGAGSGKTIFGMQYLVEGLQNGEAGLYLTFEEKKGKLYEDMNVFGWNLQKYENEGSFHLLEYSPEQVKSLIEEGGGTIEQLVSKAKIRRVVIDSITSFVLLYQDELLRKEAGLALFELINKWGCTALLTSQGAYKQDELQGVSLEFEADNIIILNHLKRNGDRIRSIEVLKMRGTNHTNKTPLFEITSKGVVVHPSKVVHQ